MMNATPDKTSSALIITNDLLLFEEFSSILSERFQMKFNRFNEEEVRNSLLIKKPLFLIWDGRYPSLRWSSMIAWLRDYYHGLPIIAIVDENNASMRSQLSRLGINQVVDCTDAGVTEALQLHIFAILLDYEDHSEERLRSAWN